MRRAGFIAGGAGVALVVAGVRQGSPLMIVGAGLLIAGLGLVLGADHRHQQQARTHDELAARRERRDDEQRRKEAG